MDKTTALKEWGGLLAGIAGVLTAGGALLKSCDTRVTQSAYETLGASIAKLSDQEQRDHADLAGLRGYLDGMSRTPASIARPSPAMDPLGGEVIPRLPALTPLDRRTLARPAFSGTPSIAGVASPVPVPTVRPAAKPVRAPDFSTIR